MPKEESSGNRLEQAVRAHAGDLLRAALGMGLSQDEAEELVQAVFAAFLEALPRFEGRSSVRTYLFGILYHKTMELRRRKGRERVTEPSDDIFHGRFDRLDHWSRPPKGPEDETELQETAALIGECLEALPEAQRAAFLLKEVERETGENIRNILDIEDTHLRVLLFRARNRLRECLEGKWKSP